MLINDKLKTVFNESDNYKKEDANFGNLKLPEYLKQYYSRISMIEDYGKIYNSKLKPKKIKKKLKNRLLKDFHSMIMLRSNPRNPKSINAAADLFFKLNEFEMYEAKKVLNKYRCKYGAKAML